MTERQNLTELKADHLSLSFLNNLYFLLFELSILNLYLLGLNAVFI